MQNLEVSIVWDHFSRLENFEARAVAVTMANRIGTFDILPRHANFISVIEKQVVFLIDNKNTKTYSFASGIVEVSNDQVKIFLESNVEELKTVLSSKM